MVWLKNLKTRDKLYFSFGVILIFLIVAALIAVTSIRHIDKSVQSLHNNEYKNSLMLKTLLYYQMKNREAFLAIMNADNEEERNNLIAEMQGNRDRNTQFLTDLIEQNKNDKFVYEKLLEYKVMRKKYNDTRDNEQIPLLMAGNTKEAVRISREIQAARIEEFSKLVDEIVNYFDLRSQEELDHIASDSANLVMNLTIIFIITLLVSIVFIFSLNHLLATPLRLVSGYAKSISNNNLSISIVESELKRRDEVGVLFNSFMTMLTNLNSLLREIDEGINVLASSSSEILASTSQVASGAAETATAVSQVTTTIEEIRQTSQLSDQKAKNVLSSSQDAEEVSVEGKSAVERSVETIKSIRSQMESIAQSIVRLSEQSQSIGEITATVEELAERSNLLAVNAAIEAAKAGDHGRGFTVVAQEVRNLAEQSKEATRQIGKILGDVQQSVSSAVMVTEQGTKSVELGVQRAEEAGRSIQALAVKVTDSAEAATQITASSQQQLIGMDQVATAMENIKLASSQNASSTKQVEQTAKNLHDLGMKLKSISETYSLR